MPNPNTHTPPHLKNPETYPNKTTKQTRPPVICRCQSRWMSHIYSWPIKLWQCWYIMFSQSTSFTVQYFDKKKQYAKISMHRLTRKRNYFSFNNDVSVRRQLVHKICTDWPEKEPADPLNMHGLTKKETVSIFHRNLHPISISKLWPITDSSCIIIMHKWNCEKKLRS